MQLSMVCRWLLALGMLTATASALAEPPITLTNSLGMELVRIPPGTFMMGSDPLFDSDTSKDELPRHQVTISKPFCLGKYEVTQGQWVAVMGKNPAEDFRGRTMPVDQISWDDAQEFIRNLNAREGTTDYRLPTEAEWEYAARAGTDTIRYWGDSEDDKGEYAWHGGNARGRPHPVGLLGPNPWGLYDILGNSTEWVEDGYASDYYARSPSGDPPGPGDNKFRVLRGGSWRDDVNHVRSANRLYYSQSSRNNFSGLRIARDCP